MPISKSNLKKFKMKELKALIRKYNLGKVGGSKSVLLVP